MVPSSFKLRRILVALDSAPQSSRSLESGAELAARLEAELFGLFVEDADLLRAAAVPLTRHVNLLTGVADVLDSVATEAQLARTAEAARARLEAVATKRRVRWSFTTVRGAMHAELETATGEADLLVIRGATALRDRDLSLRAQRAGAVLVIPPGTQLSHPVSVCIDDSPGAVDALQLGATLAAGGDADMEILISADDEGICGELEQGVRRELQGSSVKFSFRRISPAGVRGLVPLLRRRKQGCLVICSASLPADLDARALAADLQLPVLMIR